MECVTEHINFIKIYAIITNYFFGEYWSETHRIGIWEHVNFKVSITYLGAWTFGDTELSLAVKYCCSHTAFYIYTII